MNPIGSEAELPEFSASASEENNQAILRIVPDESAQIAVLFPAGHTLLDRQILNFGNWAEQGLHSKIGSYLRHAHHMNGVSLPDSERATENSRTLELFKKTFHSFLWTGIECSNPESPHGERWDQLALTSFYDPQHRAKQISLMKEAGIENVRLGLPNHKMVEEGDWDCFTEALADFKAAGIKVSLDLQHFGLPGEFRNDANPEESVYLNPKWPAHFVEFAMQTVKKYLPDLDALTLINEPMITNRFSACFWNEAMPGNMADLRYNHYFIKRALLIGKAAAMVRLEIEHYLKTQNRDRIVFIHNESCERHASNPEFNDYGRFLASDLILGHEWLLDGDFTETDIFNWMRQHVVDTDADLEKLISQVAEIRDLHRQFKAEFGKSMKADTVFGVDYYAACETIKLTSGFPQPTSVEMYAQEVEEAQRLGLAGICAEYWNRYQLPMLHTETNFVDHGPETHVGHSDDWGTRQLIEFAQLSKAGIPILGFTWYSLLDQFNWHNGMQGSPRELRLHPVGLFSWPDYEPRPFARTVLPQLVQALSHIPAQAIAH